MFIFNMVDGRQGNGALNLKGACIYLRAFADKIRCLFTSLIITSEQR